jgi:hypothetical protein
VFEVFQPLDIGGLQAPLLGFPLIVRCGTDAVAPSDLVDGAPRIRLLENADDLRLGELRLAHGNLLARVTIVPEDSPYDLSTFPGSLRGEFHLTYISRCPRRMAHLSQRSE